MTLLAEEKVFIRVGAVKKAVPGVMDGLWGGFFPGPGETAEDHATEDQQAGQPDSASHRLPFPALQNPLREARMRVQVNQNLVC